MTRRTRGGNDQTLQFIQACVRAGRYLFTEHALTRHPFEEGFTPDDALDAIMNGEIIEDYPRDYRCLVSGMAPSVEHARAYIGNYLHCVVRYDRIDQIVIITMYRPRASNWRNHYTRLRQDQQ